MCIPTSSGTGSEVTPFAVITDHKTGYKYPITDYALTPSVAIVDPVLARTQPRKLASDAASTPDHSFELTSPSMPTISPMAWRCTRPS